MGRLRGRQPISAHKRLDFKFELLLYISLLYLVHFFSLFTRYAPGFSVNSVGFPGFRQNTSLLYFAFLYIKISSKLVS